MGNASFFGNHAAGNTGIAFGGRLFSATGDFLCTGCFFVPSGKGKWQPGGEERNSGTAMYRIASGSYCDRNPVGNLYIAGAAPMAGKIIYATSGGR